MPNAKPFPLYTDGASIYYTTDGVHFNTLGGGGGSVASVTGVAPGIVDNTDPANPVVQAQFGSDVTVPLPNAASTDVPALELITSLVNNVAGAEESRWLIKLLAAGAQVSSYVLGVLGLTVPAGSQASPSINVGGGGTGMYRQGPNDNRLVDQGTSVLQFSAAGGIINLVTASLIGWLNGTAIHQGGPNNANLVVTGAPTGNAEIGPSGANATNATAGFLNIPTVAGTPTGVPANVSSGKVSIQYDTTAHKIWVYDGAWKSTAALT